MMNKILLVSNPIHPGIQAVAKGYSRAFQHLGIDFDFLEFRNSPVCSIDEANAIVQWKVSEGFGKVIFIQPSYFTMPTYLKCLDLSKKGIDFYCINTDDPYSTHVILQIQNLFKIKFSNEKTIADKFKMMSFDYLPLAFDSLQPYRKSSNKNEIDVCAILSVYENRVEYLEKINNLNCTKFIGGTVAPLTKTNKPIDISYFNTRPELMPRHKEYEYYSNSKMVINPHRNATDVGKSYLNLMEGIPCMCVSPVAISPNPRFFDAIGCGAFCLSDPGRTECLEILNKYTFKGKDLYFQHLFKIPELYFTKHVEIMLKTLKSIDIWSISKEFAQNESYVNRAQYVLKRISL